MRLATRLPVLPVPPSTRIVLPASVMTPMISTPDARINVSSAFIIARYAHAVDVLQEHLARARASGGVFARSVAHPPWGLRLPGTIQLAVHAVIRGRAWLWLAEDGVNATQATGYPGTRQRTE